MGIPHLRVDCDVFTPHATSLQPEIIGLAQLGEKMGSPDGYLISSCNPPNQRKPSTNFRVSSLKLQSGSMGTCGGSTVRNKPGTSTG